VVRYPFTDSGQVSVIAKTISNTISKKLSYSLSPQPPFETGALVRRALVDRCVAPVDRNGIT
jgi:hypothetical protein